MSLMPADVEEVRQIHHHLCALQQLVMEQVVGYEHSADCFCGQGGFWPLRDADDYRNELLALDFIEEAVTAAIMEAKAAGRQSQHPLSRLQRGEL